MKIRFYERLNGARWLGFILAMLSAFLLSGGDASIQWMGWSIACVSCSIWLYMGYRDGDIPRALMELFYLLLAIRGVWNWLQ